VILAPLPDLSNTGIKHEFMRVISCLTAAFMLFGNASAAAILDSGTQQVLVQLETKYFGHSFDEDAYDVRTERLEKLIFGTPTAGDLPERIEKLVTATGSVDESPSEHHTAQSNTSNLKTASAMPQVYSDSNKSGSESYPHIATLENEILGQTYPSLPLNERLKKMEIKAFGSASDNPDLSERTDILDWYAEKKLHKTPFAKEEEDEANATDAASDQPPVQSAKQSTDQAALSEYPHITTLEQEILGQTYDGDPLTARLSRMETKAFGSPSKSTDLSQRTDALEKYAEKKLHKKPFEQPETASAQSQQQGSKIPAQVLSMVANSILGMGGMGFGGIGPGGWGPGGLGAGGMPVGGSPGLGFGGSGFRSRSQNSQQQQQEKPESSQLEDDPEVYQTTPPPANAKLLTKVGWCEIQVYGQTFPKMHLEERLGQLNRELHVKPGATNVELLDDVGLMIKAVQAKKKP
jgi:hypothetical protein